MSTNFQIVNGAFERACARIGCATADFRIGGTSVRTFGAGGAVLERIIPAVSHLRDNSTVDPDLKVYVWDSASTGIPMPPLSWFDPANPPATETLYRADPDCPAFYSSVSGVLSLLDLRNNRAHYWTENANNLPVFEASCPLRTILHWWHSERGRIFVHAGCVGYDGDGVLITGMSGKGKSTTALTCLLAGMQYVSDDYILLDQSDGTVVAHSLYGVGKLVPSQIERFPLLARLGEGYRSGPHFDKTVIMLNEQFAGRMTAALRVRAVVVPEITGARDTRSAPAPQSRALLAMMPSTMFQLPGAGAREFGLLSRAVKNVPCFILHAGTELEQIPGAIRMIIEKVRTDA